MGCSTKRFVCVSQPPAQEFFYVDQYAKGKWHPTGRGKFKEGDKPPRQWEASSTKVLKTIIKEKATAAQQTWQKKKRNKGVKRAGWYKAVCEYKKWQRESSSGQPTSARQPSIGGRRPHSPPGPPPAHLVPQAAAAPKAPSTPPGAYQLPPGFPLPPPGFKGFGKNKGGGGGVPGDTALSPLLPMMESGTSFAGMFPLQTSTSGSSGKGVVTMTQTTRTITYAFPPANPLAAPKAAATPPYKAHPPYKAPPTPADMEHARRLFKRQLQLEAAMRRAELEERERHRKSLFDSLAQSGPMMISDISDEETPNTGGSSSSAMAPAPVSTEETPAPAGAEEAPAPAGTEEASDPPAAEEGPAPEDSPASAPRRRFTKKKPLGK